MSKHRAAVVVPWVEKTASMDIFGVLGGPNVAGGASGSLKQLL